MYLAFNNVSVILNKINPHLFLEFHQFGVLLLKKTN